MSGEPMVGQVTLPSGTAPAASADATRGAALRALPQ